MIIRNLLFTIVCISFLQPVAKAQHTSLDLQVLIELMEHRHEAPLVFFQHVSNTTNLISMMAPITVLATGFATGDKVTTNKGWYLAETLVASTIITTGLKYSINRPRPSTKDSYIIPASNAGSPSFPSGHTSEAFATATSLTIAYPKWYVAVPAYAWASTVGYSRMYLGVHYPSDVLAGAVVGAGSALLVHRVNKWLTRKKPAEVLAY